MSKEMREQIDNFKKFILKESKKEKIFINGFEYYLDRDNLLIYDKEDSSDGISIYSNRLTKNEKDQIWDYIKFGR
jgi:hypothetical protein